MGLIHLMVLGQTRVESKEREGEREGDDEPTRLTFCPGLIVLGISCSCWCSAFKPHMPRLTFVLSTRNKTKQNRKTRKLWHFKVFWPELCKTWEWEKTEYEKMCQLSRSHTPLLFLSVLVRVKAIRAKSIKQNGSSCCFTSSSLLLLGSLVKHWTTTTNSTEYSFKIINEHGHRQSQQRKKKNKHNPFSRTELTYPKG